MMFESCTATRSRHHLPTRRQLPNVGVQDDARRVLNAGIWLYQPLSDHIGSILNILILSFLILIRPHYNQSSYCVFPDAEKRLKNHGANDFGEKEEESLFIKYLSGVSLFCLFTLTNDSLLHNSIQ